MEEDEVELIGSLYENSKSGRDLQATVPHWAGLSNASLRYNFL
jgi:hypothetical protein